MVINVKGIYPSKGSWYNAVGIKIQKWEYVGSANIWSWSNRANFSIPAFGGKSNQQPFPIFRFGQTEVIWKLLTEEMKTTVSLQIMKELDILQRSKASRHFWGGLFRNRNSWNDQNNLPFRAWVDYRHVRLWRFYSYSGIRVTRERTIVWLIPTIPIPE